MSKDQTQIIKLLTKSNGNFPNNPDLPVVIYRNAVELKETDDAAAAFEAIFAANAWENSWRNGIYDYHHYHSTAHEVLGIYAGEVNLQTGGPGGKITKLQKGDVVILPAGVSHKNTGSSDDFKCVGAYPAGQDYDMNYGKESERPGTDEKVSNVPYPVMDPVFGKEGPLIAEWVKRKR